MKAFTLFMSIIILSALAYVFGGFYTSISNNYGIEQDANLTVISEAYVSLNESQSQIKNEIETAKSNPVDGLLAAFRISLNVGKHILGMISLFPSLTGTLLGYLGMGYISPFIDTLLYSSIMLLIVGILIRWYI